MNLRNPLEMNDWGISSFMLFSFSMLALLWISFLLNSGGFQIPLVQQVAGCICLLFVPGIAVLRSLRLHRLGSVDTPLYAIGISISVVIFAGLLLNTFAPPVGINNPLSDLNLMLVFSGIIVALCIISYKRDWDFAAPTLIPKEKLSPRLLSLLLLPFLSIFGAYLVNYYEINWLIILMLISIGVVVFVGSSGKSIDSSFYPLAIFVISLSLLLSNALISRYLWGWDIFAEAYVANSVVQNGMWNSAYAGTATLPGTIVARYNDVLSVSILAPVLSKICDIDITSLFKIIYPLIFSLVPVALYQLFRKQTDDIIAFLASFFFVSMLTFSLEMPSLARQEIAEFLLVLVLLLIFNKTLKTSTKAFLLILFSGTMIVSHYGLAWLFMIQLILVLTLLFLADSKVLRRVRLRMVGLAPASEATSGSGSSASSSRKGRAITVSFVFLFAVFVFGWYTYTAKSLLLSNFLSTITNLVRSDLLASAGEQVATNLASSETFLEVVIARLNTVATLLIFVGVVGSLLQRQKMRFDKEYLAFAIVGCGLAAATLAVPVLSLAWNASRLQSLSLIILAPFCVLGIVMLFNAARRASRTSGGSFQHQQKAYTVASIFLVLLFLLNSGFAFTLTQQPMTHPSPSLFHEQFGFVHEQDLSSAQWLGCTTKRDLVYGDYFSLWTLIAYGNIPVERMRTMAYLSPPYATGYIYVRSTDAALIKQFGSSAGQMASLSSIRYIDNMNKVYDSGSAIYTK